jgi:hypothetical protein
LKTDFAEVPVAETAQLLGGTAAKVYGFDLEALWPIADRIGFTPEDLGQDPSMRADPDAAAKAKWWLAEYGISPTR